MDNFVAEQAFYNGSAKSKLLHELVTWLRKLEMQGCVFLHFMMGGVWSSDLQTQWSALYQFWLQLWAREQGPCISAWYGKCYQQHAKDKFPVMRMQDLDDALMAEDDLEEDDPLQF
jgi:hypothetical protein